MPIKILKILLIVLIFESGVFAQDKINFTAPGLYPEGVAYDPGSKLFYVGSVTTATIGSVDMMGNYKIVYQDTTLKSTYGLKVDTSNQLLWACVSDANYSKYSSAQTFKKVARLIAVDLASGKKIKDIDLANLKNGSHFINDIAFDDQGGLYATDSFSPVVYKIDKDGKASVFAESELFKSEDIGLNGIAFDRRGFLIVNNNSAGALLKIDVKDPKVISRVKIKNFFPGADGMLFDKEGNLILVQNKSVDKIFKITSSDGWQTAKVLGATAAEDRYQQPSTNTVVGNDVYILNSKMNELSDPVKRPSKQFSIQKAIFNPAG